MYRTHTCGELNIKHVNTSVTLSGWVQKNRALGGMIFIDLRDRYGITQLSFHQTHQEKAFNIAKEASRESVVKITGKVIERESKNKNLPTGDIEVLVDELAVLSKAKIPPFTILEDTDGGEEDRMKYRYLDLRRPNVQEKIILRSKMAIEIRNFLNNAHFLEIETPFLIKSTPEGARDFVVPSRMNPTEFYALPQSPQTFKQLLMVSGFDRYFQIVRCFRDEDLRADRQPEFTQLDCEMAFVTQEDVLQTFEALTKHMFETFLNKTLEDFPRMPYKEAIENYGSDKPDLRFDMIFKDLSSDFKGQGFQVFDKAEIILGIAVDQAANYSRKQIDGLTDFVKKPQIGAKGMVYVKYLEDGSIKSSIDKFFTQTQLQKILEIHKVKKGQALFILAGQVASTRKALGELRLHIGKNIIGVDSEIFKPLWVTDFPLLEYNEEHNKWHAMHHPFTSPKQEDLHLLDSEPHLARANAYDLVVNGVELGGGSIRIHQSDLQEKVFEAIGFTKQEAKKQFGFLMDAFTYGAPPHGGIAFGFDRWVSLFSHSDSIREVIAFPKNNMGKDVMINAPSKIDQEQLNELALEVKA